MSAPSPTRSICYPALILLSAPRGRILWTTPMGYLVPWCYLQGAQEDVGEKEESEVRELVLGAPSWGGHSSCWALLAQVSHNCSVPSPHQPQSHSLESCTTPLVPPRAWAHFCKVLFIGLSSNCLHLNMSSLFARIPSLSKTFVCSDTDISAAFLLKLTLKTVKSKLLQAIAKFFP